MNKKTYKIGLLFCLSVFVFLTGLVVYEKFDETSHDIPVVSVGDKQQEPETKVEEKLTKPFAGEVQVARSFYDQNDDAEKQGKSLVLFEGVYRPNQGADFTSNNKSFEILASLSGTVISKKDDPVFGLSITIESDEGVKITYQSLSETSVELNAKVKQGDVLGKSGENLYEADLGNHLHFIIEKNGTVINPEKSFDKTTKEL